MQPPKDDNTLLGPYRVLDFADQRGALCGNMLAAMGADVICIEPPEGSPIRTLAPFYHDEPGRENSLVWWALSANKRSAVVDFRSEVGRDAICRLLETTDFLVESFTPGYLESIGLSYAQLKDRFPRLIYVSITPYGQTGPHSRWAASDLNLQAMGGHTYLTGDSDRPPVRVGVPASYWHGGSEATAAAMIALHHRHRSGHGQHVDVSIQQCVLWTLLNTTMTWQLVGRQEMRGGAVRKERGNVVFTRNTWQCKDGLVQFVPVGGGGGTGRQQAFVRFVAWMKDEGFDDESLTAKDWNDKDMYNFTQAEYDVLSERIAAFLKSRPVAEVYERSIHERLLIAPITTLVDVMESSQLAAREFFVEVDHAELEKAFSYPGPFAKFSETPLERTQRAPFLGQHTSAILGSERE
jgi:crotonobetainyl-CoA:carnitine CoA-transferase CaiB-like acyl-CoA transferase